jgi:hypothetical protein
LTAAVSLEKGAKRMKQDAMKILELLEKGRINTADAGLLLAALTGRLLNKDDADRHLEDPRVNRNYVRYLLRQV